MSQEEAIEIRTADGMADAYVYRPAAQGAAGVLIVPDILGIRESSRTLAARLSEQGYVVLLPNVFYRTARGPTFTFKPNFAEERTQKRFMELTSPITPDAMNRDAAAYLDYLAAQPAMRTDAFAVVGYCFGGGHALRIAAWQPDRIAAAVSFHGGRLCTDSPNSPHRVLPSVKARLYFGHAVKDGSMPQEAIDKLDAALAAWGGKYESEIYDGALHGWTMSDHGSYNEAQAERAFRKLNELLGQTLKK
jgi:carboxymethylenebutenolidase